MPTIAEKLRQEGMQHGMQQGRQEVRQEEGALQSKCFILLKQMQRKFSLTSAEDSVLSVLSARMHKLRNIQAGAYDWSSFLRKGLEAKVSLFCRTDALGRRG